MERTWMDWDRVRRLTRWLKRERPGVLNAIMDDVYSGLLAQYRDDSEVGEALAEWRRLGEPE